MRRSSRALLSSLATLSVVLSLAPATAGTAVAATVNDPVGQVDQLSGEPGGVRLRGWALDPDTTAALQLRVTIDDTARLVTAGASRSDVGAAFPGTGSNHGVDVTIATAPGTRTVCVTALNVGAGAHTALGCGTVTVPGGAPIGNLEKAAAVSAGIEVAGWAIDPDVTGPVYVWVTVDGQGRFTIADRRRTDVATVFPAYGARHGFSTTIAAAPGTHQVCATINSVGQGGHTALGCRSVRVGSAGTGTPIGSFESATAVVNGVQVKGWALDPDVTTPVYVWVTIDGVGRHVYADLERADVGAAHPAYGAAHGFLATLDAEPGSRAVCATIANVGAGGHTALGCRTVTVPEPVGGDGGGGDGGGGDGGGGVNPGEGGDGGAAIFPAAQIAGRIQALPQQTVKALPTPRLASGLMPPTNRWFSGLVFGQPSHPVFPYPLTFQLQADGYAFGLPTVTSSSRLVNGGFAGHLRVGLGADNHVVTAYDDASVTISQRQGATELGKTVIAQGWPFVAFTAARPMTVTLGSAFTAAGSGVWTVQLAGSTYGLVSDGQVAASGTSLTLAAGQRATWFVVAQGGAVADYVAPARAPLTGTTTRYAVTTSTATTTLRYATTTGAPTLVATLPHQAENLVGSPSCTTGTYRSVLGTMRLCELTQLSWTAPTLEPSGTLDLSGLSAAERSALATQVAADATAQPPFVDDTYFGGKSLYRVLNLYQVARAVGATSVASDLKARLVAALDRWTQPGGCTQRQVECFVYDPAGRGVVGLRASFGSDEYNDHHFHYGYFLYTAGVLAAEEPALAPRWAPVMDLLAADIASSGDNGFFPDFRVFDVYASHSWASGPSPFADGNNQESSSEAVSAWNGLALWAKATGQRQLETAATWMLSAEASSSLAYWTNFPLDDPMYDGFDHTVTSLVWGGKRDYATWFTAEPSAMLGILVLPMSPVAHYLAAEPDRIRVNLADSAPNGYDVMFGDFLLMYASLQSPAAARDALTRAQSLPANRIDDGSTRSYLYAFILSQVHA